MTELWEIARERVQVLNAGAYLAVCFGHKPDRDMFAVFDSFEYRFITPWLPTSKQAWLAAARRT